MLEIAVDENVEVRIAQKAQVGIGKRIGVDTDPLVTARGSLNGQHFGSEKQRQGEATVPGVAAEIVEQTNDMARIAIRQVQGEGILEELVADTPFQANHDFALTELHGSNAVVHVSFLNIGIGRSLNYQ